MNKVIQLLALLTIGSLSISTHATDCSKDDVDHYLQSGFSHEQIVKLCTKTEVKPAPAVVQTAPQPTSSVNNTTNDEAMFFKLAIKAKTVDVHSSDISYVAKECLKFGIEDMTGEKELLCRDVKTTINYANLDIISATQGIFLISKHELVISGTIKREVVQPSNIPERFKADFTEDFVSQPTTLHIPIRDSIDPVEVGQRLMAKAKSS